MKKINRRRVRLGITRIELIVVLVIVAVVAGILFPSVQQAREAARRTSCNCHLKQIGLALHNYHDAFESFPPGFTIDTNGKYQGWSWSLHLLPFLDAKRVYDQIDLAHGVAQFGSSKPPQLGSGIFRCPSQLNWNDIEHTLLVTADVEGGIVTPESFDAVRMFPRSSYFGNAGYLQEQFGGLNVRDAEDTKAQNPKLINRASIGNRGAADSPLHRYCDQTQFQGVFGQNSYVAMADLKDGTTNTFMIGERYVPDTNEISSIGHGSWVGVANCTSPVGLSMALGDTSVMLNKGLNARAETTGFGSVHAGGSQFLWADGSVRSLSNAIDISLYRNLSTIDDRTPTPDF